MKKVLLVLFCLLVSSDRLFPDCAEPSCFLCDPCGRDHHLIYGAEGLFWTVYGSNLDYAVDFNNEEGAEETLGPGNTHFLEYNWKAGVRGWFGWNWCCGWDLRGVYTYYQTEARGHVNTQGSDRGLKASLLHPATLAVNAEKASGTNHLRYESADILFGRLVSYCSNTFFFTPYFGIRGIRLEEKLRVLYEGDDFVVDEVETPGRVHFNSNLYALGLHAGFDLNYRWCGGVGLYGGIAGSLLAAHTSIRHRQEILDEEEDVEETLIHLQEKQRLMIAGYHLNAGINWDWCCGACLYFRFRVGYEFNQYFDAPQLRRYQYNHEGVSHSATAGDLCLHGGIFRAEMYF